MTLSLFRDKPHTFAGISVLRNGDLIQLPTPGDAPSCKEISSTAQNSQALGKALYVSLFNHSHFIRTGGDPVPAV